jgi:NADH-quinone oxidoreductase subunit H
MSGGEIVLTIVKIVVLVGFLVNMAAIGVWADRRQSAMVQDRVGPNRAVVYLPSPLARGILVGAALIVVALMGLGVWSAPTFGVAVATVRTQIAVLVLWVTLLVLGVHLRARAGDERPPADAFDALVRALSPRACFYGGVLLHLITLAALRFTSARAWWPRLGPVTLDLSAGLLCGVVCATALYAASLVPPGKVGLRLAGTLHALADGLKLIWKEDLRPKHADRLLYALAPVLAMFPALVTIGVIPFGNPMCWRDANGDGGLSLGELFAFDLAGKLAPGGACPAGHVTVSLAVADLDVGLLYVFAIAGTGIIGAAIAGWASDNKFALLGGLRATSQMVSYEVAMGLAIVGMLMVCGTVHMQRLVDWQGEHAWGIFVQPLGFLLFFAALVCESKRIPFDQPEGESEIVAGYFLEYSGMRFGLFFLGEYAEFAFSSALLVTLFFGGYHLPFLGPDGVRVAIGDTLLLATPLSHAAVTALHVATFFAKTILLAWLMVFIRWTLPRFRYDQVMKLGWTTLLPLALANILCTGIVMLVLDGAGDGVARTLRLLADLSQGIVALGGVIAFVAAVAWLLEPVEHRARVRSSAERFAAAAGGTSRRGRPMTA